MESIQQLIQTKKEEFRKDNRKDLRVTHDADLDFLESTVLETAKLVVEDTIDYIEANALWIKEDVHDGNDGNYHVSKQILSNARAMRIGE